MMGNRVRYTLGRTGHYQEYPSGESPHCDTGRVSTVVAGGLAISQRIESIMKSGIISIHNG